MTHTIFSYIAAALLFAFAATNAAHAQLAGSRPAAPLIAAEAAYNASAFASVATLLDAGASQLNSRSDRALANALRCQALIRLDQFEAAMAPCDRAVASRLIGWAAYNNRGVVYAALGNRAAAEQDFLRALRSAPRGSVAHRNRTALQQGDSVARLAYGGQQANRL